MAGLGRRRELVDLLAQGLERRVDRAPLEPPSGRAALHLRGARERRQRGRDVVVDGGSCAGLGGLELLPVHEHLVGAGDLDLAEHVRMAVHELLDEALRDVVDVPPTVVGGHLRMEHDLQQHVAELVAHRVVVAGVDRLEQLVGLLEQVPREALMGLLGVPGTPVRVRAAAP